MRGARGGQAGLVGGLGGSLLGTKLALRVKFSRQSRRAPRRIGARLIELPCRFAGSFALRHGDAVVITAAGRRGHKQ